MRHGSCCHIIGARRSIWELIQDIMHSLRKISQYRGEVQSNVVSQKAHHLTVPMSNQPQPILSSQLKDNLLSRHIGFQQDCQNRSTIDSQCHRNFITCKRLANKRMNWRVPSEQWQHHYGNSCLGRITKYPTSYSPIACLSHSRTQQSETIVFTDSLHSFIHNLIQENEQIDA